MGLGKDEVMEKAEIMTDAERDKLIAVLGMAVLLLKEELQGLHNEIEELKAGVTQAHSAISRLRNDFTTRKMMQSVGEDKQEGENTLLDLRIDVIHHRTDTLLTAYERLREDQKGLRNDFDAHTIMVSSLVRQVLELTNTVNELQKLVLDKIVPPVV